MAIINFDASQVTPDEGRTGPLPTGWYVFATVAINLEPTRDGTGQILKSTFQVSDGPYQGRKVFHNFNIKNNSEKAQEIAYKQFSALCHAVRVLKVQDTAQLLNIPFKGRVKIETDSTGQYEAKNIITAFKDINDTTADITPPAVFVQAPKAPPVAMPPPPPTAPQSWQAPAAPQPWANAPQAQASTPIAPVAPVAPPQAPQPVAQAPIAPPAWNPQPAQAPQPVQEAQPAPATQAGQVMPPWMAQAAQ